jgi:Icc-related predicted phosphoesterase
LLKNLPKADVIVHSGDTSFAGSDNEVLDFLNWFCDLDYPHKIFVAGNHDNCLYDGKIEGLPDNVHYLYHSGIEIENVKFWGVPLFVEDSIRNGRIEYLMTQIPENTQVLISHSPPYGILDFDDNTHYGCSDLQKVVGQINPRYHLFGHVHAAYGIKKWKQTTFVNAAIMSELYEFKNKPFLLEI